jgi:hypothetical protein
MNSLYQTLLRPQPEHKQHSLKIAVLNRLGHVIWTDTLRLQTLQTDPHVFFFWELPTPILPSGGAIRQVTNEQSELSVVMEEDKGAVAFSDLSQTPLEQWPAMLKHRLAGAPAAIAVMVIGGRISLVLNEGGEP